MFDIEKNRRNPVTTGAPKIALVVATRNRAKRLEPFFESLRRLKYDGFWELVVVDNASTDETGECLKAFASSFTTRVTIVTEPKPGLGRARNRGWRATSAPVVAFTDDDCYPDPGFLNETEAIFSDESLGVVGGRILLHDPTDARITIAEWQSHKFLHAGDFVLAGFIQGANMAFRRQALVDIDGFDDNLGAGTPFACEDVDAVLRALAAGWKAKFDPRPAVYHHHGRKPGKEVDSLWQSYTVGRGAYYMKCILFMPQRWRCLWNWLNAMKAQPFTKTLREVEAAIQYAAYMRKQRPNVSH